MCLLKRISVLLSCIVVISMMACKQESTVTTTDKSSTASDELTKRIEADPDNAENYFLRGERYYGEKMYNEAIADLERAIELDTLQPKYFHLLSDSYLDYYRSKRALMVMEEVVERFPDRIPSLLKLSETQYILKQYEQSLLTVTKILIRESNNPEGHFMKGMNFRAMGEIDKAIGAFQMTTELNPEHIDAWLIAGDLFDQKGLSIALDYYEAAINIDPENVSAWHSKAFYLQNNGKDKEAIAIYKKINHIDKSYLDAYLNAGILYMTIDSLDKAMEQFNIMASIKPQNHLPYYYRGLIYDARGDTEAARTEFQNSVNLNSEFSKAKEAIIKLDS